MSVYKTFTKHLHDPCSDGSNQASVVRHVRRSAAIETLEIFRLNIEITGAWNFLLVLILYNVWFCTATIGFLPLMSHSKNVSTAWQMLKTVGSLLQTRKTHTNSRPSLIIYKACLCQWCRLSCHAMSFLTARVEFGLHQSPECSKETAFPKLIP